MNTQSDLMSLANFPACLSSQPDPLFTGSQVPTTLDLDNTQQVQCKDIPSQTLQITKFSPLNL